ncbi:Ldh family oxidoreductase [Domibacillus sp. PGB-M46]|uniref:Ldh family oxidoreductase n=1 Tax=Domibacillus sp. PGB-M46 TaxID=2910255 RepID=UPI001F57E404|nr:Ldh family oxidoreductase [Domibacillus sp. PGB-M46]MCI2256690.1 Ldh family oxidoreductase [Domibacillus sp. PGB-M46]
MLNVQKEELEKCVLEIFQAAGLDEEQASIVARHLVLANLRGIDSHGVSRVDIYTKRLDLGIMKKKTEINVVKETSSSMLLDGGGGVGIVLATKGMQIAVEKAKTTGIAIVGINHSSHCGMLADYTAYAAQNNCIGLAVTNAPSSMAPWGGKKGYFGTNPLSYGIPAGKEIDIVFDMATSVVARGKITLARQNNQEIPIGWAISKEGYPTTDPIEAGEGLVLPVGGPKGYGLAFFVEVLSGLLTGATFGPYISSLYKDLNKSQNIGQFFLAIRADLFEELASFKKRMDQMIEEIRNIPLAHGYDRIYLPGEIEYERSKKLAVEGIPLSKNVLDELASVVERYGLEMPV